MRPLASSLPELHKEMEATYQAPELNMLQHGILVHQKYLELMSSTDLNYCPLDHPDTLTRYHIYHDCGKHLVAELGDDNKTRYPNHTQASAIQFKQLFPDDVDTLELIERDMDFHVFRGDDLNNLCRHPKAVILYATSCAEILANATMFGGTDSESYKIKKSRLIQAGKKLSNHLNGVTS